MPTTPLRVASVPATHVYVRRLAHPRVERLRDPTGDDHRTPCFLDPDWWRSAPDVPALLHVHFGFEYYDPDQLVELGEALRSRSVALVYTVHDLRNPNHPTPDLHDAGLDALVPQADELITLTGWARDEVRSRFGRDATVLPHPHVAPLERIDRAVARRREGRDERVPYRLGIHLKSLRANMVGAPLLAAAADVARDRGDVLLEAHLHNDVVAPSGDNHDAEVVDLACALSDEGLVDLRVHPYLPHGALLDLVERCDGYVLPYRFGTHSGLLEACRDLGTAVLAPACGGYADQGAHHVWACEDERFDPEAFRSAVDAAVTTGPPRPLDARDRDRERREIAHAHERIYRAAVSRSRTSVGAA